MARQKTKELHRLKRRIRHFRRARIRPHATLVLANPRTRKMPYAPAIAIGAILSFFALP